MIQRPSHNGFLFGALLTISFLTVVALWLPSAQQSLSSIVSGVGNGASSSAKTLEDQWRDAQEAMKDALPQSAPVSTEVSPDTKQQLEAVLKGALATSGEVSEKKSPSLHETAQRKVCTRAGGTYDLRASTNSVCVFTHSECDAEMFTYNKCHIGQYTKAEDGIPEKADLVLSSLQSGIVVLNRGRGASGATTLLMGGKDYSIPPLAAGASFTVETSSEIQVGAVVDPNNEIKEIIEENNTL